MADSARIAALRDQLGRTFPAIDAVFDACAAEALRLLSDDGVNRWLAGVKFLGSLGRGAEPALVYLEEAPRVAEILDEAALDRLKDFAYQISRTPNGEAMVPFLQTSVAAASRMEDMAMFELYLDVVAQVMEGTTTSVHGIVATHPSPCFVDFLLSVPTLTQQLSIGGMKNWVSFGINGYPHDPEGQRDYFALQSPVAHTVLQRERHGTLLVDHERLLTLYLTGLWNTTANFRPYSLLFDELRQPKPYLDTHGTIHMPDVYDDLQGEEGVVSGVDRYRAILAHIAAHQRWTQPIVADNLSPFQRMAAEVLEDMRVDWLALREWPGLRQLLLQLHPKPVEGAVPADWCGVYHRLACFSRAVLDPDHGYQDAQLLADVAAFHALMAEGCTTQDMAALAIRWYLQHKQPSDLATDLFLDDVEVEYRDDNRHMWLYIEPEDEDLPPSSSSAEDAVQEYDLPPKHYDEWDAAAQLYLPDWVSLYERLHPAESAAKIDAVLEKHAPLVKRLQHLIDLLKPQNKVRIRYQEEGTELDLDVAIRSLIDFKSGAQPDPRINMSHRTDGRSIAVSLLLDLSVSLNDRPEGCSQTILELSQEAVALLGWAVEQAGDPLAIGGFHSNTRHEVRYYHFKGFSEPWGETVKGRLAAMDGAYSTRMGAALRHAGFGLRGQTAEKKLLLVLTDGRPHDVDVKDEAHLIHDAHKAVQELDRDGIYTYCINLDSQADEYVADIFGQQYTVIDHVERLPERLPELFIALTK